MGATRYPFYVWTNAVILVSTIGVSSALGNTPAIRLDSEGSGHYLLLAHPRYAAFIPRFPGQGSDKPGTATLRDDRNCYHGEIPLPQLSMAYETAWQPTVVRIRLVGEWDLSNKHYRYWNDAQTMLLERRVGDFGFRHGRMVC